MRLSNKGAREQKDGLNPSTRVTAITKCAKDPGHYLKRSWAGEVRNVSVLVAIGVGTDGYRDILGIVEGAKEDKDGWGGFLRCLKQRGLKGVQLIVSDKCLGLVESLGECFPLVQ